MQQKAKNHSFVQKLQNILTGHYKEAFRVKTKRKPVHVDMHVYWS